MTVQTTMPGPRSPLGARSRAVAVKLRRGLFLRNRFHVLERDVYGPLGGEEPLIPVEWRKGTHEDVDSFTKEGLNYDDLRKRYAHEALDEGGEFVVAVLDGEIVHTGWISYKHIVFPGFTLRLGPARAYFYDTRTVERFRGNRLQGAGIRKRLEIARERGVTHVVNCVDVTNGTSRRNYMREGFEVIASMETRRFLRSWWSVSSPDWLQPYLLGSGARLESAVMAG